MKSLPDIPWVANDPVRRQSGRNCEARQRKLRQAGGVAFEKTLRGILDREEDSAGGNVRNQRCHYTVEASREEFWEVRHRIDSIRHLQSDRRSVQRVFDKSLDSRDSRSRDESSD